jgi:hypothetical protein
MFAVVAILTHIVPLEHLLFQQSLALAALLDIALQNKQLDIPSNS